MVRLPFRGSAEKLWLKDHIYDIIIIIDYNLNPTIKFKGSAIFLHLSKNKYQSTKGCVAINKDDMKLLIGKINKRTKLQIY